jgi:hypothetical protein
MTHTTETLSDGTTRLTLDFSDEGVELTASVLVKGDVATALAYMPFFEVDLRRNNAELFPTPEPDPEEMEMI